jgi:hypothetical protein
MRGVVVFVSLIELHREGNGKKREKRGKKENERKKGREKAILSGFLSRATTFNCITDFYP